MHSTKVCDDRITAILCHICFLCFFTMALTHSHDALTMPLYTMHVYSVYALTVMWLLCCVYRNHPCMRCLVMVTPLMQLLGVLCGECV